MTDFTILDEYDPHWDRSLLRSWSSQDDRLVRKLHNQGKTAEQIADTLQRTPNAVAMRKSVLGLTKVRKTAATATHCLHGHLWSEHAVHFRTGNGQVARRCKQCATDAALRQKAKRLASTQPTPVE